MLLETNSSITSSPFPKPNYSKSFVNEAKNKCLIHLNKYIHFYVFRHMFSNISIKIIANKHPLYLRLLHLLAFMYIYGSSIVIMGTLSKVENLIHCLVAYVT